MGHTKNQTQKPNFRANRKDEGAQKNPHEKDHKHKPNRNSKENEAFMLEQMQRIQKENSYVGLYDMTKKDPLREATVAPDDETIRLAESLRKVFTMGTYTSRSPDEGTSGTKQEKGIPMEGITTEAGSMVTNNQNMSP